jgi:hypothetical protein
MIFPGMDPYLEDPLLWSGVHASLIVYIRNQLQPLLRPRYVAAIEERVFVEGPQKERIPDVLIKRKRAANGPAVAVLEADAPVIVKVPELEVHESFVTILDLYSKQKLVTVIEVVSPTNKYEGPGRKSYRSKQREIRQIDVHLVEVDLLRTGRHVVAVPERVARAEGPYDYLACVNRARELREDFELYPRTLGQRLSRIRIPLAGDDPDVVLDVQAALEKTYEDGVYADLIDYAKPCRPRLARKEQAWADSLIRKWRRRGNGRNGGKSKS